MPSAPSKSDRGRASTEKVVPARGETTRSESTLFRFSRAIVSKPLNIDSNRMIAATGTAIATMLTDEMMLITECDFGERT